MNRAGNPRGLAGLGCRAGDPDQFASRSSPGTVCPANSRAAGRASCYDATFVQLSKWFSLGNSVTELSASTGDLVKVISGTAYRFPVCQADVRPLL